MEKEISYEKLDAYFRKLFSNELEVIDVIFNNPATIVFWNDGSKSVVKCDREDTFDKEKGLAMAIVKRLSGNKGNYYNLFKQFIN